MDRLEPPARLRANPAAASGADRPTRGSGPPTDHSWDRGASACLALLLLGTLGSLAWFWHPYFDPRNDACMYILLARTLLAGEGYTLVGEPFALRPPGFSCLIAPLVRTFGSDAGPLNLFVGLTGVAAVALLFVLARRRIGSWPAFALAGFLWLNPGFRTFSNQVMSDVPGIALALGCLVLERRWRTRPAALGLALGIAIGLGALVRSMNLLLVPAVLLAAALRSGPWAEAWSARPQRTPERRGLARGAWLLLGCTAVLVPWSLRNARADLPAPTEQTSIYSYGTGMFHRDASDPSSPRLPAGEVLARIPAQALRTLRALGARMIPGAESSPGLALVAALALLCVVRVALRRGEPAELFVLGLAVVVSSYFAFVDRLVLPIFVLALPATWEVVQTLGRRILAPLPRRGLRAFELGAPALLLAFAAWDARHIPDPAPLERRAERMRTLAAHLERSLPPNAPLAARLGYELGVYLEARDVLTLYVVAKRGGRPAMLDMLERRGVRHAVFHWPTPDDRTLRKALGGVFRPAESLGDWRLVAR